MKVESDLRELFTKYLAGSASPDELLRLLDTFQLEEDSALLRSMIIEELEDEEVLPLSDSQQMIISRVSSALQHKIQSKKSNLRALYWGWGAAAAVLVFMGIWIGYNWERTNLDFPGSERVAILPGEDKATLILEDGSIIALDSNTNVLSQGNFIVKDSGGIMTFHSSSLPTAEKDKERTVRTPKGGQFAIILSDNTKVWLNAESSITFPTEFNQDVRQVEVTGEAYFEVAKNTHQPFLVHGREQVIKVLGTHFNVNTYPEHKVVRTALLEGSVMVMAGGKQLTLRPGEMSLWYEANNGLAVEAIPDAESIIAWKEGMFSFNNSHITEVMQIISRWYDVDFSFKKGDYSNCVFSGLFSKKDTIQQVLNILSASQLLTFEIRGKEVIVSPKIKKNTN